MSKIVAFHGEPSLKAAVMERLREHRRMDEIVQGTYFAQGRGCHLGCITHANNDAHETAERLFGIEQQIGHWLEAVFEALPEKDCAKWVIESTEAIPCGADLSLCRYHLGAWLLGESGLLTITDDNRAAIEQCHALQVRAARGEAIGEQEWSLARASARASARAAAREAARAAARASAEAARAAAWAATWASAREAARASAWASAEAARAAAWAATWASAWAAAEASAWHKIAAKSIEIFASAPVVAAEPMPQCVRDELFERQLWCDEQQAVVVRV